MFRAFFDESGTDPRVNKALVLGGFLGSVEEWERASDAWDSCLGEKPVIDYFKHGEAQSLDGQFARLNRATADAKVLSLAKTITRFPALLGFCVSVPYRLFVHRDAKASKGVLGSRVYDWGFLGATSGVMQYLDDEYPGEEEVDFIFDERRELIACIAHYNQMKSDPFHKSIMHRAGQCSPGNDQRVSALQMADLLAWEFSKAGETKVQTDAFNLIAKKNKIVHVPCRPPHLLPNNLAMQKMLEQVRAEAINFLARSKKNSPNKFASVEEIKSYMDELRIHEAYVQLELKRYLSQMDADAEYQAFRDKYLEAYQTDEEGN